MSQRSGDNRGQDSRDVPRTEAPRSEAARPEAEGSSSTALTLVRRTSYLLSSPAAIDVPFQQPVGMASAQQLDAFRELRTKLLQVAEGLGKKSFTTLVVQVKTGSGVSFVTRNLAAAFTLQEHRTAILIDCNIRNPTQHKALGLNSVSIFEDREGRVSGWARSLEAHEEGLFDFIDSPHQSLERLLLPTAIPGLHLIPAGKRPRGPREYFSSQSMKKLVAGFRDHGFFVFLDGPGITGSPDARILSDLADFVILVTSYGRDTGEALASAASMFDPKKFVGVVFNERP